MNHNRQLNNTEKQQLMKISQGSQKGRTPQLINPDGTKITRFQKEPTRTGIHDNLPVRGNWK